MPGNRKLIEESYIDHDGGGSDLDQVGCGTQWCASGICFEVVMDKICQWIR